jgi:chromosome segregation ATPase
MENVIDVEYREVMPLEDKSVTVLTTETNELYARAESVAAVSMMLLVEAGKRLRIIKERVGHGGWGDWIKENLNFSQKKANRLMNLAEKNEEEGGLFSNSSTLTNIEISKVWALLEAPEEVAKEALETAPVEDMTVKNLQEELKRIKAENEALSQASEADVAKAKDLKEEVDSIKLQLEMARKKADRAEARIAEMPDTAALEEQLETAKKALRDYKKKVRKEQDQLKAAAEAERESIRAKAEEEAKAAAEKEIAAKTEQAIADAVKDAEGEMDTLRREVDRLQKLSDPATGEFKAHVDSLQQEFSACLGAIDKAAPENKKKWRDAMRKVVRVMEGQLE